MSLSSLIWPVAELLRGDYKQSDYGKVVVPFTVLRRLDCVLEHTKKAVLAEYEHRKSSGIIHEPFLLRKSGVSFCNTSPMDLKALLGDQDHIAVNLNAYIQAFSPAAEQISISDYLDSVTSEIDALTDEAEQAIELLLERSSALISAAVTGKVDVRKAIPECVA